MANATSFKPGNQGGKKGKAGRKSKAEEMGLAALLDECWTPADRKACIRNLATAARNGNMEANKLLMAYAYGKPIDKKEHSGDANKPVILRVIYDERGK